MLQESEKYRRGKETDRTHGIEFTLARRYCHQHSSRRHLMITLGQTHYLLQSPTSFPRQVMVDLNYNTAWDLTIVLHRARKEYACSLGMK
jgi:hypothetical protein